MGRTPKHDEETVPTSVKIPKSKSNKLKYMAWFSKDKETQTSIILKGVDNSIAAFEAEHGEITTKKLEQGRII